MATRSRSPTAASKSCIKAGWSSSPIFPPSQTCGTILPKATPLRRWNAYRISDCSSGHLAGLCPMPIRSCAIQTLNGAQSDSEIAGQSGNFSPRSSNCGSGVGLPKPLRIAHSLTASSMLRLLLTIVTHLVSYCPTPILALRLFPLFSEFSWLPPAPASTSATVVRMLEDHTVEARTTVSANP